MQSVVVPIIVPECGGAVTVMSVTEVSPEAMYKTESGPAATPVTTPPESTVAISGIVLTQWPPATVSTKVRVPPTQTLTDPAKSISAVWATGLAAAAARTPGVACTGCNRQSTSTKAEKTDK